MDQTTPLLNAIQRIRPWQLAEAVKRATGVSYEEREIDGLKVWLDPGSIQGHRLLRDGYIERTMTDAIQRLLPEGGTFVDVGANEGWFSLHAARAVGPGGRVLTVEPQERLWPVILRNFALNDFWHCHLAPVAVADQGNRTEIILTPSVNTGASSMVRRSWFPYPKQEVVVKRLDHLCDGVGLKSIDVAKIDVEGFDLAVLRSASSLLDDGRIRHVLMELHEPEMKQLGEDPDEVFEIFDDAGYEHEALDEEVHHFKLG